MESVDPPVITTKWLGWPVYAQEYRGIDPGFGFFTGGPPQLITQKVEMDVEIGLCSDGVVVWREKNDNNETT